jgi:hypothetical protein
MFKPPLGYSSLLSLGHVLSRHFLVERGCENQQPVIREYSLVPAGYDHIETTSIRDVCFDAFL